MLGITWCVFIITLAYTLYCISQDRYWRGR